jgi:magnesium-transporting ATPase (P-type)
MATVWLLAMTVTMLLSFVFFSRDPSRTEQSSFAYNLALVLTVAWMFASCLARMVTFHEKERRYRWLNVLSLVFFACMYVAIAASPGSPDRTFEGTQATLRSIEHFAINIWTYGCVVLELGEIFL